MQQKSTANATRRIRISQAAQSCVPQIFSIWKKRDILSSGIRRGRRKSLEGIVELLISYLRKEGCTPGDCNIIIGYGHDRAEALDLQSLTHERLVQAPGAAAAEIPICRIGATIGVHAGPTAIGYGVVRRSDRL